MSCWVTDVWPDTFLHTHTHAHTHTHTHTHTTGPSKKKIHTSAQDLGVNLYLEVVTKY
jgi:hypothetical protein